MEFQVMLMDLEGKIASIIAEEEHDKAKKFKQFCNESNSVNILLKCGSLKNPFGLRDKKVCQRAK